MAVTTADEALDLVRKLDKRLTAQSEDALKWRSYYEGEQPLHFSSREWREWFGSQFSDFADNWCAPVVDATAERQKWVGFRPYEAPRADADLSRVMSVNGADVEFGLAATEAQFARRAYMSVWGNSNDESTPIVTFESPTQVILQYAAGSRRIRTAALKRWRDEDGRDFATLYTPEFLWKFWTDSPSTTLELPSGVRLGEWRPRENDKEPWPLPNPLGEVPIVELPNRTTIAGEPMSAIGGVAAMQDAINLLWAHLFTASDFAALPQRIVLGAQLPKVPVLDNNGQKVGEKVVDLPEMNYKRIMNLEGPNAKVDEWKAADLKGFLEVIKQAVGHISDQTRTPSYYFSSGTTIANISGDTVKALDAGLVQKVNGLNDVMRDGLRDGARLICKAQGDDRKAAAMAAGTVEMGDPEIRSDAQLADALSKYRTIGFPFEWVAKQKIDDPDELAEVLAAYEREQGDATLENLARTLDRQVPTEA